MHLVSERRLWAPFLFSFADGLKLLAAALTAWLGWRRLLYASDPGSKSSSPQQP